MAGLALAASAEGLYSYFRTENIFYAYGAATWSLAFPFTYFIIRPIYTKLLKADEDKQNEGTEPVINEWVAAHKGRLLIGIVGAALYLYAEATAKAVVKVVVTSKV